MPKAQTGTLKRTAPQESDSGDTRKKSSRSRQKDNDEEENESIGRQDDQVPDAEADTGLFCLKDQDGEIHLQEIGKENVESFDQQRDYLRSLDERMDSLGVEQDEARNYLRSLFGPSAISITKKISLMHWLPLCVRAQWLLPMSIRYDWYLPEGFQHEEYQERITSLLTDEARMMQWTVSTRSIVKRKVFPG